MDNTRLIHYPLLDIRHIDVCYNGMPAVEDVSLTVRPGEILGIVGESGSGKSTVIRAAMGLLGANGMVTRGDIYYKGINIPDADPKTLRSLRGAEMGMIFQNAGASLSPIRTIGDQMFESVRSHEKISREEADARAVDLFARIRLDDGERILESYPFELSGGMNQRVGIVMAMLLKPDLLFADEPTSALDVTVQAQVVEEMLALREAFGTAIVIVSHNIAVIEKMADTIAVMHHGKLVEYGPTQEVIRCPKEEYTRQLLGAVLRLQR
ncbi:MAG: ABC transporter ATP-binding protein [Eubacterium sp.]|nr:ABC transporter ATP-binding protein [Eubacterium sp.]